METSPTPRTPNGWSGLGTSTRIVSIFGRSKQVGMRRVAGFGLLNCEVDDSIRLISSRDVG